MLIAGLTGGMACGKTFVANALRELGCSVIEADLIGHEVLAPGGAAFGGVVAAFGNGILKADGQIDRARLAEIVFGDAASLARLNAMVHPAVRERSSELIRAIRARDPKAIVIYVAAILVETGGFLQFDKLIVVNCTREQQIARAMQRPGATMEGTLARIDRQLPLQKKREFADYIIEATGTAEETLRQTKMVFEDLRRLAS